MMPNAPPAPPMPPPMAPPKKSKLPVLIVVFGLLAVIFIGVSMATPWYNIKYEMSAMGISASTEINMDFQGTTVKTPTGDQTTKWADAKGADKTKGVYGTAQIMDILGLVMCILLLVGGVLLMMGPQKKMLALIFGLLAFIFAMLGPVLFMAQHPGAMKDDGWNTGALTGSEGNATDWGPQASFSGSKEDSAGGLFTIKVTWGPALGWIMALMGFIFALLGFILVLLVKKPSAMPAGAAPLPPPPMGQPPAPPYP